MLRRTALFAVATLGVGVAIGSCDSPGGEGRLLGTEPAAAGSQQTLMAADAAILGCVGQGSGMLRVPPADQPCRENESPITLGGGLAGYEVVTRDDLFEPGTTYTFADVTVECPAGKRVLGGGAGALRDQNGSPVLSHISHASFDGGSYPVGGIAWRTSYTIDGPAAGVRGFAVCAY